MLGMALFNSPVSVLDGFAPKEILMTSSALQEEQIGQRGPIGLGEIIPLYPNSSEKEAETTAKLLSPDGLE